MMLKVNWRTLSPDHFPHGDEENSNQNQHQPVSYGSEKVGGSHHNHINTVLFRRLSATRLSSPYREGEEGRGRGEGYIIHSREGGEDIQCLPFTSELGAGNDVTPKMNGFHLQVGFLL